MKEFGIKHHINVYVLAIIQDLKSKMQFRADFFLSLLGILAHDLSGFVAFWVLFRSIENIIGWNYNEIIFLYGFALLAKIPAELLLGHLWSIQDYVFSGDFIVFYLRPINVFIYYISKVFDAKGLSKVFFGVGIFIYAWYQLGIEVNYVNVFVIIISLFSASLVAMSILILASSSAFWLTNPLSIMIFIDRMGDYARYPVTIFNKFFRFLFSFIVPIGFIAFYPGKVLLRPNEIGLMQIISPLVGIAFLTLSYKIWMKGTKIYSGTGS